MGRSTQCPSDTEPISDHRYTAESRYCIIQGTLLHTGCLVTTVFWSLCTIALRPFFFLSFFLYILPVTSCSA